MRHLLYLSLFFSFTVLLGSSTSSWGLDLLPKKGEEKSDEGKVEEELPSPETRYWLMSGGEAVGFNVDVEINGSKVSSIKRPQQALEITDHVHPGLNTVKFVSKDTKRKNQPSTGALTLTLGPEGKREKQGAFQTYIELKDMVVHFPRPAAYRADESAVEMKFSVKEDPNPELTKRYILYAQGEFSGHLVHVAINGVPFLDVVGPGTHLDLNPYLVKDKNEITFSASRMEGVPFTSTERDKLAGKNFEVGVAIVGDYDPATYNEPVTQVSTVVLRYEQPADQEEPEEKEMLTLMAE